MVEAGLDGRLESPLGQLLTDAGAKASAVTDSVVPQTRSPMRWIKLSIFGS